MQLLSPTKAQLRSHMNSKHGELKLKCEFCYYKFPCNWRLKQHTERRNSSVKPVRSNYGKGKKGLSVYKQPLYSRAENDEKLSNLDVEDFKCHQCTFVGSNKSMLQDHKKRSTEN